MTIYTLSILNAYPYFWILWWKVLEERDVFGWLPCTLGEIELFLLVLLCHDFSFFIFCMIFWLRQLSREILANKRALVILSTLTDWEAESPNFRAPLPSFACNVLSTERLRVLSSQLLWLLTRAICTPSGGRRLHYLPKLLLFSWLIFPLKVTQKRYKYLNIIKQYILTQKKLPEVEKLR